MTTDLSKILKDNSQGLRELPNFSECAELLMQITAMETELKFYKTSYEIVLAEIKA